MPAPKLSKQFESNGKRPNSETGMPLGTECKTRINRNKKTKDKGHLEMQKRRLAATNCMTVTMVFRKLSQHNISNKLCPSSNLFIQTIVVDIEGVIIHTHERSRYLLCMCSSSTQVSCYLCDVKPLVQFCFTDHKTTPKLVRRNSAAS